MPAAEAARGALSSRWHGCAARLSEGGGLLLLRMAALIRAAAVTGCSTCLENGFLGDGRSVAEQNATRARVAGVVPAQVHCAGEGRGGGGVLRRLVGTMQYIHSILCSLSIQPCFRKNQTSAVGPGSCGRQLRTARCSVLDFSVQKQPIPWHGAARRCHGCSTQRAHPRRWR